MILKNFSLIKALSFGIMTPFKYPLLFVQSILAIIGYLLTTILAFYVVGGSISINGSLKSIWQGTAFSITADAPGYIGIFLGIASIIACLYIFAGLTNIAIRLVKNKSATIKDLWISVKQFGNYLLVFGAYLALVIIGTILLVIPGIYFAYKYLFAPIIALDYGYGVTKSFEISRNITFGAKLKLFISMLLASLLNGAATIAIANIGLQFGMLKFFGIQMSIWMLIAISFFVWIVIYLALIHIYHQLLEIDGKYACDPTKDYCG